MSVVNKPYTFSPNTSAASSEVNSNFDTIYNDYNGSVNANNIANGSVTEGKIGTGAVTNAKLGAASVDSTKLSFGGAGAGIWWEEIGRTTLSVAGDTITVSSIPARKYLLVLGSGIATGGTLDTFIRFNNDSGNNYAHRYSLSFAAAVATVSTSSIPMESGATDDGALQTFTLNITNIATQEKNLQVHDISQDAAGAATNVVSLDLHGKWANTTDLINRIDWLNLTGTGDFAIGSEVIVLGHN